MLTIEISYRREEESNSSLNPFMALMYAELESFIGCDWDCGLFVNDIQCSGGRVDLTLCDTFTLLKTTNYSVRRIINQGDKHLGGRYVISE